MPVRVSTNTSASLSLAFWLVLYFFLSLLPSPLPPPALPSSTTTVNSNGNTLLFHSSFFVANATTTKMSTEISLDMSEPWLDVVSSQDRRPFNDMIANGDSAAIAPWLAPDDPVRTLHLSPVYFVVVVLLTSSFYALSFNSSLRLLRSIHRLREAQSSIVNVPNHK